MLTTYHPPPIEFLAIDRADLAPRTKHQYTKALRRMIAAGVDPTKKNDLQAYAVTLKPSSRAFLKSALKLITQDLRLDLLSNSDGSSQVIGALHKLEAMQQVINVPTPKGDKAHFWLSREQVTQITALPDLTALEGRRDWIVLSTLLASGMRREELVNLRFDMIVYQPNKKGKRAVLNIVGKGSRKRVIPISETLHKHLMEWKAIAGEGLVMRSITNGRVGESLSAPSVFNIVRKYGALIGMPELSPHDLRRTYATLGLNAGIPITQISTLLGHSNIATTQRYLNLELNVDDTISDYIPLSGD